MRRRIDSHWLMREVRQKIAISFWRMGRRFLEKVHLFVGKVLDQVADLNEGNCFYLFFQGVATDVHFWSTNQLELYPGSHIVSSSQMLLSIHQMLHESCHLSQPLQNKQAKFKTHIQIIVTFRNDNLPIVATQMRLGFFLSTASSFMPTVKKLNFGLGGSGLKHCWGAISAPFSVWIRNFGQNEAFNLNPRGGCKHPPLLSQVPIGWISSESTSLQKSLELSVPSSRSRSRGPIAPTTLAILTDVVFRGSIASNFMLFSNSFAGGLGCYEKIQIVQ